MKHYEAFTTSQQSRGINEHPTSPIQGLRPRPSSSASHQTNLLPSAERQARRCDVLMFRPMALLSFARMSAEKGAREHKHGALMRVVPSRSAISPMQAPFPESGVNEPNHGTGCAFLSKAESCPESMSDLGRGSGKRSSAASAESAETSRAQQTSSPPGFLDLKPFWGRPFER